MPRRARLTLQGVPMHIIQRGNNRQACFYSEGDYLFYLQWLEEYSHEYDCSVHAYVLMTNHAQLLITPQTTEAPGLLMKRLGQRYVQYVNRAYRRSGTMWEGRFRSCLTQNEEYLLACHRYIELNPVRANMVEHPAEYPWSSYSANAQGMENTFLKPHALYTALGNNDAERQQAYRELFRYQLDVGMVAQISTATNGNYALGNERFQKEIAAALGCRVIPGKSGRPRRLREYT